MTDPLFPHLWAFRRAKKVSRVEKFGLGTLVIAGIASVLKMGEWWFRSEHVGNIWMFLILSLVFWYGMARLIIIWLNYLGIRRPEKVEAPQGLKVAIFTTSSPGEPISMFEKTLEACSKINYPHTTYLLDDTQDPAFREVAEKYGAVWMELVGLPGAKAGKINAALSKTSEDFILVLDPDHIPFPNFLDEVLGFFKDPDVGYVQVSQGYYNQFRSFTAKAAAEQTYTFYGPTQMGMNGYNCSVAIGANCTFRRKALESVGGHGIGLAEDLVTAIRIHSEGWKSIYHPVIVARGLVPEDFGSFCKQQLKWARGVYEVLFEEMPRLFKKLSFWQRISYLMIGTYYFEGFTSLIYLVIPFLYFWIGILPAKMSFLEFVLNGFPIVFFSSFIYLFVQKWLCDPDYERGIHWRGMVMKFACWPVFFLSLILSLLNKKIPYIPTAKQAVIGSISPFAKPLLFQIGLFLLTIGIVIYRRIWVMSDVQLLSTAEITYGMLFFAMIPFLMAVATMYSVWESGRLEVVSPWEKVEINQIDLDDKDSEK